MNALPPSEPVGAVPAVEIRDMSVQFGGVRALDEVSLSIDSGRVHGIIGPNGSGKTTLLNAICGFVRGSGQIALNGRVLGRRSTHARIKWGLGRTFQNPAGDDTLTVRDLFRLGEHVHRRQPWWRVALAPPLADADLAALNQRAGAFLTSVGLALELLDAPLTDLSAGVFKLLDIGRAVLGGPQVLLLDEPTSGMNESEIARLEGVMADLGAAGVTLILVEHNLGFVSRTCEVVSVFAGGRVVGGGTLDEVMEQADVIEAYLGGGPVAPFADAHDAST